MKIRGKHVILSFVSLVIGFLIAFSYHVTTSNNGTPRISDKQWERDFRYREQLIALEEKNRELFNTIKEKQDEVREYEEELAKQEGIYFNLVEDVEKYRMFVGEIDVQGEGIEVTLSDAEYVPDEENVNNYIVHEGHVFKVINELLISGASAIAINGQRISRNSYILCNGPVIEVDGNQHAEPFVITAIGEANTLYEALYIIGGIYDQLVSDNIFVNIDKKENIMFEPLLGVSAQ
ncbi:DUF881 domain-containing protein [Bacillus sp. SCS-151]|uniref:DUF881 domain-containing protein n=1 Tax=Nanhaiella sioensis TaxID=3115293 RepID=UPI00397C4004